MKLALATLALVASSALAEEPPVPQLFRGIGAQQGQWRMEILEAEGRGRSVRGGMAITLCTDNLYREARERAARRGRADCTFRVLKDAPEEALVETECPDGTSRISMKREGAKSLLMQAEVNGSRGASTMKARYTYEGACTAQGTTMRFDKDSDACRQLRSQLAQMDPDKSCARAAQRDECEARMRAAAEQMAAMCR
ncbi:MAG: hypothetical protein OEV81_12715 [Betaproteobacteria bacterium]|nr:hypothetical protein [Betaproteobacteria bacterium]MDH5219941.1 hypothetical protein [Betaproteobacteria bacterium]MDH5350765.1 hypothetical protein [Betaproteobacteria bacterium]